MESLGRQQLRNQQTRKKLLGAAEVVFVRDGYEAAQLDAIAATAGRSKGAVYAHFKKEDLSLVLFEYRTSAFIKGLVTRLRRCADRKQSLNAFRDYVGLAKDRARPILNLKFKLFALRHPDSKERLRRAFETSKGRTMSQFTRICSASTPVERKLTTTRPSHRWDGSSPV